MQCQVFFDLKSKIFQRLSEFIYIQQVYLYLAGFKV